MKKLRFRQMDDLVRDQAASIWVHESPACPPLTLELRLSRGATREDQAPAGFSILWAKTGWRRLTASGIHPEEAFSGCPEGLEMKVCSLMSPPPLLALVAFKIKTANPVAIGVCRIHPFSLSHPSYTSCLIPYWVRWLGAQGTPSHQRLKVCAQWSIRENTRGCTRKGTSFGGAERRKVIPGKASWRRPHLNWA